MKRGPTLGFTSSAQPTCYLAELVGRMRPILIPTFSQEGEGAIVLSPACGRGLGRGTSAVIRRMEYGHIRRKALRFSALRGLLAGGDKSTQDADIKRAIEIAKQWRD